MSTELQRAEALAAIIHEEGYRAIPSVRQEVGIVQSAINGYRVVLSFASEGTLQVYCGVNMDSGAKIKLEALNKFNSMFRFAKMYIDEGGDFVAQADFFFDDSSENARSMISRIYALMETTVSEMKVMLADAHRSLSDASDTILSKDSE